MELYRARHNENPRLMRALIPKAENGHLMRGGGISKAVPEELKRNLTRVHEAGHAVLSTVLLGFGCEFITIERSGPAVKTARFTEELFDGNEDLVDMAGLYAELRFVGGELGYCYVHLKNATHDLDNARGRLAGTPEAEVDWASRCQPQWEEAVAYFWPAILALSRDLPETGRLERQEVEHIVRANRPTAVTPESLRKRLKAEYVVSVDPDGALR